MSGLRYLERRSPARASAIVRLCAAREELWRAQKRHADARGTPAESGTLDRIGEAAAEVATREQWLHWINRGTSLRPEADGDWGQPPEDQESANQRPVDGRSPTVAARRRREIERGLRPTRLRSVK
jgi:hypothetical protein